MPEPLKTPEEHDQELDAIIAEDAAQAPADPQPVLEGMGADAEALFAKEQTQVPPEAAPIFFPQIEPPPQQDILQEMGEVVMADAGLDAKGSPKDAVKEAAQFKAGQRKERLGKENPFPQFRVTPPAPVAGVMREMNEAIGKARAVEGPAEAGGMPAVDVERMADAGAEQEAVMKNRFAAMLDGFRRMFDTQNRMLEKVVEMLAEHERKLHEHDGFLERSRS